MPATVGQAGAGAAGRSGSRIWVTWERHRRSENLSREIGMRLFCFERRGSRAARYAIAAWQTVETLIRERPALVAVQSPSLVLALLAVEFGRWTRTPVVVDAHNGGIDPGPGAGGLLRRLAHRVIRRAALTIVTNDALAETVRAKGGRPVVLPDPLPALPSTPGPAGLGPGPSVLFVCSWAADEPYLEVIEAASRLDPRVHVYITGRSRGRERAYARALPPNVTLTGYLPEEEYVALLRASDLVIDLTTREDCLVCGAYEAVSAGKPLLVSDTRALRDWFGSGPLYTANRAADIAARIADALARRDSLEKGIRALRADLAARWAAKRRVLDETLDCLTASANRSSRP